MVVVGGIYSPNHYSSHWLYICRRAHRPGRGAPDTTLFIVWCVPRQPTVGVRSSRLLTSSVLVVHRIVQCDLTSQTVSDLLMLQTAVAVDR
jgi:hypothetical protein